jgi:4-hydroxybenzoate polyprenyltransferase
MFAWRTSRIICANDFPREDHPCDLPKRQNAISFRALRVAEIFGRGKIPLVTAQPATDSPETKRATPVRLRSPLGGDFIFLLKSSRPGFWLTSIWFYLFPVSRHFVFDTPSFWLGILFCTFPLGILIYGWNDIMDVANDQRNARKGTFLFGARGTDEQLRRLPWVILLVQIPFAILFAGFFGIRMWLWYAALVAATGIYNLPRWGFKNFPVVDMLNQTGYLLLFYLSSVLNGRPQLPPMTFLFGALFAMHSHLLGQIMDIVPDRLAGRRTTASVIGVMRAKVLMAVFLGVEAFLMARIFRDPWLECFFLAGVAWFVFDAFVLFRDRSYPARLARLFLLGWNFFAVASFWHVWARGNFSMLP